MRHELSRLDDQVGELLRLAVKESATTVVGLGNQNPPNITIQGAELEECSLLILQLDFVT